MKSRTIPWGRLISAYFFAPFLGVVFFLNLTFLSVELDNSDHFIRVLQTSIMIWFFSIPFSWPGMLFIGVPTIILTERFSLSKIQAFFVYIVMGYLGVFMVLLCILAFSGSPFISRLPSSLGEMLFFGVGSSVAFFSWMFMYVGRDISPETNEP